MNLSYVGEVSQSDWLRFLPLYFTVHFRTKKNLCLAVVIDKILIGYFPGDLTIPLNYNNHGRWFYS